MNPIIDQVVSIIALFTFGGLALALYVSERRNAKLRDQAERESQAEAQKHFQENQAQLDEVLANVEKRRQDDLDNLNHLKHAIWDQPQRSRREWRPGDEWPGRGHDWHI